MNGPGHHGPDAVDHVGVVGDPELAERIGDAGIDVVRVDGAAELQAAARRADACVVDGAPPTDLEPALESVPVPVVVYADAEPSAVSDIADDFLRRTGSDLDRLFDRLAWVTTTGDGDDARKIEQLHEIATQLLARQDADAVYDLVVEAAQRVLEFDICIVDAVEGDRFVPKAVSEGLTEEGYEPAPVEDGGLAGEAHRTGESSIVDDIRDSTAADPAADVYRSVLTVPIGDSAVFQAASAAVGAFDESDRELAELLAAHAEGTLHRIRSEQAIRRRQETIHRLHDIVARMVASDAESELYDLVVDAAEEVLEFSVCVVVADDPGEGALRVRTASDVALAPPSGRTIEYGAGVVGETFRTGDAVLVDDVREDETATPYHEQYRSVVSVPMGDAGVVQAISTEPGAVDEYDLEMAELLASQAGAVLRRLRAQSRLRTERDRLRALFDHVPDPAVSYEFDGGTAAVRDVNPAFEDAFGFDAETAVGAGLADLIVPDDDPAAAEVDEQFRAGRSIQREVRRATVDGEVRDFLIHVVPTERSGDNVAGYSIYTDITERKRRERRLNALNRTTRELLGASDAEAVAEIAVDAAREIIDLPATAVYCEDDGRLVLGSASATAWELFADSPPEFGPGDEVWAAFEAGESRLIERMDVEGIVDEAPISAMMVFPLGEYGAVISGGRHPDTFDEGARDLGGVLAANVEAALSRAERERRLRDRERELQRQNERLEEFASVVSHDLRTPLSVARGNLDLARSDRDDERLRKVADAHERMDELLENLLALAREGRVVGETDPVDVRRAAEDAWASTDSADARLVTVGAPTVAADRDRLGEVVGNLFRNAVEHAGTDVTVEVGPLYRASEREGFYVADDGQGIPESDRETVFEHGYTTSDDGTGYGLTIVREIAEAHGWSIETGATQDGGARFEIRTR
ncbi:MAG: GAF domain-containing protein [Halobacteriales archaeon]